MFPKVYLVLIIYVKNMKPIALMFAFVLFSSGLGYGSTMAFGQYNQPCSVSHPCAKICGDHPCAPGETYTLSANQTTTVTTGTNTTGATQTGASGVSTNVGITASATATKTPSNMTMTTNGTITASSNMTATNATATASTNMTITTTPKIRTPKEQVASGTQPKDVKCKSGFELIINQFNSRPACVKSDIASLLVTRGWGMLVSSSP